MKLIKKHISIIAVLLWFSATYAAQDHVILHGKVLDSSTKEAIPFVNIGIANHNIGTASNFYGEFQLKIPIALANNSVVFSTIGYASKSLAINTINKEEQTKLTVYLVSTPSEIEEVEVKPLNQETIGFNPKIKRRKSGNGAYSFHSTSMGQEIGTWIELKHSPAILKNFKVPIRDNEYDSLVLRLNIYSIKNEMPDQNLLKQNIIISAENIENETLVIPLDEYNIIVHDDFIATLEWLTPTPQKVTNIFFGCVSSKERNLIYDRVSQGKWNANHSPFNLRLRFTFDTYY